MIGRLRDALARTGMAKKDVAEALDVTPQALTGWLRTGRISKESLAGLARLAGMTTDELLQGQALSDGPSSALPPSPAESLAPQASQSVELDNDKLERSIQFLERQFAIWDREFVLSRHTRLIAGVYARIGRRGESNLVELSQWLTQQIEGEDSDAGSGGIRGTG